MDVVIHVGGIVRYVYAEGLDLTPLGSLDIRRASQVEPTDDGLWTADLASVGGPQLGPFRWRSEALAAEQAWLAAHWLAGSPGQGW